MSIRKLDVKDAWEVLSVINRSNAEFYRRIIPPEHFKEPVFTYDELLTKFKEMTFYAYQLEGKIIGVAALQTKSECLGNVRFVYVLSEYQRRGLGRAGDVHRD